MELTPQRRKVLTLLVTALVVVALWWVQQQESSPDSNTGGSSSSAQSAPSDGETDSDSGLPIIQVADLPPEAVETLELIDAGGPYPYSRDGVVFENREDILPQQSDGYYKEFTVPTPGSDDRGARRIVTGSADELYWTDDHYSSFSRISR